MPNFRMIALLLIISVFLASVALCAEKTPVKTGATKAIKTRKDFTKADFIDHIKGSIDRLPEVMNFIKGLKKEKDVSGNVIYTYQDKRLEDLDKEQLSKLYSRISTESTRIRTDRINAQLETIRRAEQIANQARPVTPPPAPPQLPPTPPSVTQPPKTPTPPPATPRR